MEIKKVRSFALQVREKDHAAPLSGIVRMIVSPLVVFPKKRPSRLFSHHIPPLKNQVSKGYALKLKHLSTIKERPTSAVPAKLLSKDEAHRIAANITKLLCKKA